MARTYRWPLVTGTGGSAAGEGLEEVNFSSFGEIFEVSIGDDLAVDGYRCAFTEAIAHSRELLVEGGEEAANVRRLHLHLGHAAGEISQTSGEMHVNWHDSNSVLAVEDCVENPNR